MDELGQTVSILVVDDDPWVLASFRRLTRDLPISMRSAQSAEEGQRLVAVAVPDIIIADYWLPGIDGLTFLESVHARYPGVERILHTGEKAMPSSSWLDIPILGKPCPPDSLRELLLALAELKLRPRNPARRVASVPA